MCQFVERDGALNYILVVSRGKTANPSISFLNSYKITKFFLIPVCGCDARNRQEYKLLQRKHNSGNKVAWEKLEESLFLISSKSTLATE